MEEAADVVVLVKDAKDALGLLLRAAQKPPAPVAERNRRRARDIFGPRRASSVMRSQFGATVISVKSRTIGARFAVGHVDVEEIGLGGAGEALEQLLRAVDGAKSVWARAMAMRATSSRLGTSSREIQSQVAARSQDSHHPTHGLLEASADGGGDFRLQTGGGKFARADEEVLGELGAVRFKGDDPARKARKFLFELLLQASSGKAKLPGVPGGGDAKPCRADRACRGSAWPSTGRRARDARIRRASAGEPSPPIARAPAKADFGICLLETHTFL